MRLGARVSVIRRCVALYIAFLCIHCAVANELAGRVVGVMDGDTIEVLTPAKQLVRVRLAGIDAPEKKQPFGNLAKQKLSALVFSRDVIVDWHKKDRFGRVVGKVFVNGGDADLQMLQAGFAWHYRKYRNEQSLTDRLSYMHAESAARTQRLGLWRDADPIPPWRFRFRRNSSERGVPPDYPRARISTRYRVSR